MEDQTTTVWLEFIQMGSWLRQLSAWGVRPVAPGSRPSAVKPSLPQDCDLAGSLEGLDHSAFY